MPPAIPPARRDQNGNRIGQRASSSQRSDLPRKTYQPSHAASQRRIRGSGSGRRFLLAAAAASAASAGLSVSELNAEITVETAIVRANCRKNCPMMPLMNAQGTNTALSTRPTAITGPETWSMRLDRGVARRQPVLDVMLDRLDHHDRVVDHDADRQHQAEQRQVVEAEADRGHRRRTCR